MVEQMDLKRANGDPIRESINRREYRGVEAVGEVDGYEILFNAQVTDETLAGGGNYPKLTIRCGGEWTGERYLGGATITESFESVWALDKRVGELLRKYDLERIDSE